MKNKLFTSFLCSFLIVPFLYAGNDVPANTYFPKGMKWTRAFIEELPGGANLHRCVYSLQGDTVIGEKTYRKVVGGPKIVPIRQEGQRIYAFMDQQEILLYDFGVRVGDSVPQYYDMVHNLYEDGPHYGYVTAIDTVTLLDGREARRIHYDSGTLGKGRSLDDIEYVGSETGLLSPIFWPDIETGGSLGICCSFDGEPLYEYNNGDCEKYDYDDSQLTTLYFEDKNGQKDSLIVVVNISDEQINALPAYSYLGVRYAFETKSHWAWLRMGESYGNWNFSRYYTYQPYDSYIENGKRNLYIPADRLPVTITWNRQFFMKNNLTGSVLSDMLSWFDVGCRDVELHMYLLAEHESVVLHNTYSENDENCTYTTWENIGLMKQVGLSVGTSYNFKQALESVENPIPSATKIFRDGQLLIERDGRTYTVTGQRIR